MSFVLREEGKRFSCDKVKGHDGDIPFKYFEIVIERKDWGGGKSSLLFKREEGKKGGRR